ncbi:CDP-diacylglycerol--glycerol-3-phosphate 3-phosphatidyltransferase [Candidatus Dependentiae bacterium]|nr:CDP-diacylglycerol--glycerol-3-phosphate 3-phosphatidyltransferase [Candidatus Dependentiae bacterium]
MNFKHNIANKLTIMRFLVSFLFIALMVFNNLTCRILALIVFIVAALTDLYDGKLARMHKQESDYGRVVDPLADKVITVTAYVFFVGEKDFFDIPAWLVSMIIIREFTISALRTLGLYYKSEVKTSKLGKWKTTSQFVAIITILLICIVNFYYGSKYKDVPNLMKDINDWVPISLMLIVFITTWISGMDYIIKNKKIVYDIAIK